jgi:hypothetical protein
MASDQQIQNYVDQRIRPHAELLRALKLSYEDDISTIDDIYATLTAPNPTWVDNRNDAPPHLLTVNDVLAINTFMNDIKNAISANAQLPIVLKACVRNINP